jgi:cytochrome c553
LQEIGGAEVTVSIPADVAADGDSDNKEGGAPRVPLTSPQEILAHLACNACHKVEGTGGELGPDLSHIGSQQDAAYIRRAILDPNAEIAEGFVPMMPPNYGDQLYAGELETLVNYLAGLE